MPLKFSNLSLDKEESIHNPEKKLEIPSNINAKVLTSRKQQIRA